MKSPNRIPRRYRTRIDSRPAVPRAQDAGDSGPHDDGEVIEAHTAARVRDAEAPLLDAGVPLMERAAFALAETVLRLLRERRGRVAGARVALLVGAGNNGGDALFAGAQLRRRGVAVTAYGVSRRAHEGGRAALLRAGGRWVDVSAGDGEGAAAGVSAAAASLATVDVVLDAILGTGATGALRGTGAEVVEASGRAGVGVGGGSAPGAARGPLVVAVDLPSGIGADDGTLPGPVLPADVTVTFGAAKRGLVLPPAAGVCGEVEVVDIGLGMEPGGAGALTRLLPGDLATLWPVPSSSDQKYSRGVLGVVAGTAAFPGAAVLASSAAVHAGVGMVRYVGPDATASAVVAARPEVVPTRGRVQAWALGPGLPALDPDADEAPARDVAAQHQEVRAALEAAGEGVRTAVRTPVVVDAGALSLLPERVPGSVVLTPHAGELAALLRARGLDVDRAAVEGAPLEHATLAHDLTGATVLLKGAVTVVVGPGVLYSQAEGPAWLATAGAGDVLTGVLGALLAAYSERVVAEPALAARLAAMAASVHGLAARAANPGGPVSALDVAEAVPGVVGRLVQLAAAP
jgi:hydroxyethylthiazole kinase-like uncharacterized protein yjeF